MNFCYINHEGKDTVRMYAKFGLTFRRRGVHFVLANFRL